MPDHNVGDIVEQQYQQNTVILAVLAKLWSTIQLKEAEKVPTDFEPLYVNLNVGLAYQLMGRNERRASVSINNQGPGTLLYANNTFDVTQTLAIYNGGAGSSILRVGVVAAGATVTIGSTAPIWVYNTGGACVLNGVEALYAAAFRQPHMGMPNQGKLLDHKHDDDTELADIFGKALR